MTSEKFEDIIVKKIQETMNLMEEEWGQISLPDVHKDNRKLAVYTCFNDLCDKVLANERELKQKVLERIEDNKNEIMMICQELEEDFEIPDDLSIFEVDIFLQDKITNLRQERRQKLSEIHELSEKDKCLCTFLGENVYHLPNKEVLLSSEELTLLKRHVQKMEEEKKRRIETYRTLRKDIVGFVEQLEKPLEAKVLLDVVCNSERDSLTKSFLLDVRKLHSDLEFEVREMESRLLELREKICSLWSLLKVPEDTREAFLSTVSSSSSSSIVRLENQLAELKELRLKNLGRFIEDLRIEVQKWWARCYVGENYKKSFPFINSNEVTEDVLETLETELGKWKKYHRDHSHILKKVDYFLALFDNMQQLEEKLKDPTRLFNTRGGALLQEEKERKRVKSELPLVEKQLVNLCSEYETVNGQPFLIDGSSIEDYLIKLWNYHNIQKEEERKNRNKKKTPSTTTSKGPKKPLILVTHGSSCRKRGRDPDDNGVPAHAKKVPKSPGPSCSTRLFSSPLKGHRTRPIPASVPKMKPLCERNRLAPPLWQPYFGEDNQLLQNSLSYDLFKAALKTLNSREVIHSSVLYPDSCDSELENKLPEKDVPHQSDLQRKAYLKGTLNLVSPLKRKTPPTPSFTRRSSIQGGASAGAFLIRSMSQPSFKESQKSPSKTPKRKNRLWLI